MLIHIKQKLKAFKRKEFRESFYDDKSDCLPWWGKKRKREKMGECGPSLAAFLAEEPGSEPAATSEQDLGSRLFGWTPPKVIITGPEIKGFLLTASLAFLSRSIPGIPVDWAQ